jgi:hypothetical protein
MCLTESEKPFIHELLAGDQIDPVGQDVATIVGERGFMSGAQITKGRAWLTAERQQQTRLQSRVIGEVDDI